MNKIKKSLFYGMTALIYISYLAIFLGIYLIKPEYLQLAMHALELIICAVLIVRFHPFQRAHLEPYDQQLIFLSASIILTNLGIANYVVTTLENSKTVKHIVENI